MKFSIMKTGQTCLLVSLCVLVTACNPDEFFPIEEFLTGEDAYCYEAKDLDSCQARADRCRPAYVESDVETTDPAIQMEFLVCIANPNPAAVDDGSTTGSTDGGTTAGGSDDGSTTGGTDGSSAGGSTGGSDPVPQPEPIPTLEDALANKCQNMSSEYLWEKVEMKKGKIIGKTSKVKVCHSTGNGSAHTIVIACPALKAHIKHKQAEDYLGACY